MAVEGGAGADVDEGAGDGPSVEGSREAWLLLPDGLAKAGTPSRQHGVTADVERRYRAFGCELIQEACGLLELSQAVAATAQALFHRYLWLVSLQEYDVMEVARSAVFLAGKLEEEMRQLRDVINVFHNMRQRRQARPTLPLVVGGEVYAKWQQLTLRCERSILAAMGFNLYVIMDHPHKHILHYVRLLDGDHLLAQLAWNYLNDGMRLDLCVRYPPEVIACSAVFLAARRLQVGLPSNPPWYNVFGATTEDVEAVAVAVTQLYDEMKLTWLPSLKATPDLEEEPPTRATLVEAEKAKNGDGDTH